MLKIPFLIRASTYLGKDITLLFLLLLAEAVVLTWLAVAGRFPHSHDTFQEFSLRLYFLNAALADGTIPMWMPYMTHGTVANWWYFVQGGFLQNIFLALSGFIGKLDLLSLYYAEIWFEHALLIVGVWLLGNLYYQSKITRIFVVIAVAWSVVWTNQIWFTLRIIYAIPIIIYCIERYLESNQSRYLSAGGLLFALQWVGNLPYVLPLQALFLFIYFSFHMLVAPNRLWQAISRISIADYRIWITAVAVSTSLMLAYFVLSHGTDQIVSYNFGRNPDNTTTFEAFRQYGGHLTVESWIVLFSRMRPPFNLDYNPYIGYVTIGLALFSMLAVRSRNLFVCLGTALFFAVFTTGEPEVFMRTIYDWFPGMQYYRHILFATVFVKLMLCLAAGFGLDQLLQNENRTKYEKHILFVCALLLLGWAITFASTWAALGALAMILLGRLSKTTTFGSLAIIGMMSIHASDLITYKLNEIDSDTIKLGSAQAIVRSASPTQFAPQRCPDIGHKPSWNERTAEMVPLLSQGGGMLYWSTDSFLNMDCYQSLFRVDHFLIPLDRYMRAYWGQPINDRSQLPKGAGWSTGFYQITFPTSHAAIARISGISRDKVQFFEAAYSSRGPVTEKTMASPNYQGEAPILTDENAALPATVAYSEADPLSLDVNQKHIAYKVKTFSANQIVLTLTDPPREGPFWLLYSDTWHPYWKAKTDGKPTRVETANLAYKAIWVPDKTREIEIYFHSPYLVAAYYSIAGLSVVALMLLVWLIRDGAVTTLIRKQNTDIS